MELISCTKISERPDRYMLKVYIHKIFRDCETRFFVGNCTVFHDKETWKRPGTMMESKLSVLLEGWKNDREN